MKHNPKPQTVDARIVTPENIAELQDWCEAKLTKSYGGLTALLWDDRTVLVSSGDYLVKMRDGFIFSLDAGLFEKLFVIHNSVTT